MMDRHSQAKQGSPVSANHMYILRLWGRVEDDWDGPVISTRLTTLKWSFAGQKLYTSNSLSTSPAWVMVRVCEEEVEFGKLDCNPWKSITTLSPSCGEGPGWRETSTARKVLQEVLGRGEAGAVWTSESQRPSSSSNILIYSLLTHEHRPCPCMQTLFSTAFQTISQSFGFTFRWAQKSYYWLLRVYSPSTERVHCSHGELFWHCMYRHCWCLSKDHISIIHILDTIPGVGSALIGFEFTDRVRVQPYQWNFLETIHFARIQQFTLETLWLL